MALTKVTGSVIKDSVSLSGNVSVGGTLTYQDVTNVDALGIGTFRSGINVSGGQLDVGNNIKIGNAGIITATELDISGDIDVDGHTNLDNTSIVGIVTISAGTNNEGLRITGQHNNCVIFTSPSINGSAGYRLNHHPSTNFLRVDTTDQNGTFTGTVAKFSSAGLDMADNVKLRLGTNQDLTLYHYGNDAYIDNADGDIIFRQGTSEKLRIKSNGYMGVGNFSSKPTAITDPLNVDSGIGTCNIGGNYIHLKRYSGGNTQYINAPQNNANLHISADDFIAFGVDHSSSMYSMGKEALRIDSAGRFLKGLTSAGGSRSSTSVRYPHFQLSSPWSSGLGSYKIECTDDYPIIFIDSNASYANNSGAGTITWSVKDSSGDYCNTASVLSKIDGTPSNDSAPGRLEFMTTTSGASPTTKMTISSEGYVTKPNQPYFKANLANGVRITGTGYVVFGSAVYNNGSHYNTSDGKFTAPVTGLYWFSSRINAYDRIDFQIRVNGNEVERGQYNTDNDDVGWWSNQMTTITYMTAGQYAQVYVTVLEQNTDPGNWCSFMGYLIG